MPTWTHEPADNTWTAVINGIELTITELPPRASAPAGSHPRYVLDSPDECVGEFPTRADAENAAMDYGKHAGKPTKRRVA